MRKKVIITGASGYLSNELVPCVSKRADVLGVARYPLSISDSILAAGVDISIAEDVHELFQSQKPDAIIHCAATNPGGSAEDMFEINELGTKNVAEAASLLDCRLVTVSTDTVLDGQNAPYTDDATASPLPENAYAVSKARGEQYTMTYMPNAVIVRTSLIYGTKVMDRGTEGFANRLAEGDTLTLFNDVIRQPVHDNALANALCALALDHTDVSGVITFVGDEPMSRYTFGMKMLDYWGIDYEGKVESKSAADIPGVPLDLRFNMVKAGELGLPSPGVSTVLASAKKPS